MQANSSTSGSIIEITPGRGWRISFVQEANLRDVSGFKPRVIHEEYKVSQNPVDILSFDNSFLETEIANGTLIEGKLARVIHNFTMDLDPGYKYIEKFSGTTMAYGGKYQF